MAKNILKLANLKTLILLYSMVALSTFMIAYTALRVDSITYNQNQNYNNHLRYHIANSLFRQGTDLLTEAVRRYVVTADPKSMDDYFQEARKGRHRDRALEMVRNLDIDQSLKDSLFNAMKVSKSLMEPEYHAMHLVSFGSHGGSVYPEVEDSQLTPEERKMSADERHVRAEKLLWDDVYLRHKTEIYSHLYTGLEEASLKADARHLELRNELLHMLTLSAVSLIVLVLALCGFVFYRRYQHERLIEMQSAENARMNAQLKEERDKSIRAEKAKSFFFSSVSHDIRTPLNSIIGFSEMLQLGIDDPAEREKALDAIITSGNTLLELINDVLDLSKLESGKMELHPVPTDVASVIDKVMTSFEAATAKTGVKLVTEADEMPFLKLDPQRIRQILFNLVGNAVKFTSRGSITVRASYCDDTFTLSVTDTGCGITKEDIGRLMSPYVQLKARDAFQGTGLGLAICKQLAQQMKGSLGIESVPGEGSTFTLRIPHVQAFTAKESEEFFSEHQVEVPEEPQLDPRIAEKRILIVDDQKLNLKILQTMLARLDITKVLTAENGKQALDVLRESGNVDVVLTDMSMPIMDGADLVRSIRRSPQFSKVPVYVITADVEVKGAYKQAGFDGMLIKPITLDKLKDLMIKYYRLGHRAMPPR